VRWQELTAPGNGVQLHVRRIVDPVAPPVLLLHGLGVGGAIWQSFARRLLPERAAVAPDLRGHGQSDAPAHGYQPRDYAVDLVAMVEELRLAPLPVVGHSLGALVALALADLRPDLVEWLALLDPPLDETLRNPEVTEVYRLRHAPAGELEAYLRGRGSGNELLAPLFGQAADGPFEGMLEGGFRNDALAQASRVSVPCLVVQGDPAHGGVLGDAAAARLTRALTNGELVKVEGASHAVHATHAAQLAETIKQWDRPARRRPDPGSTPGGAS
jgi:pimeloyl-ACP methyl ester carboxylesterase